MMRNIFILIISIWSLQTSFAQFPEQKLVPEDIDPGDFFGRYLDIRLDDIIIGAHQDDENGYASGSIYLFRKEEGSDRFTLQQKILPSDGNVEEFFGYSIQIDQPWAVTGSHHDSDFGGSSGSAFVLKKENGEWAIAQKLLPSDPKAGDEFGKAVGLAGDNIAVGCFLGDDQGTNSGSVYMFHLEGDHWIEYQELGPDDPAPYDQFGNFLSLGPEGMVVGVPEKKDKGNKSGCAYLFRETENGTWEQVAKMLPEDLQEGDEFGQSVHLDQHLIAIGAYKKDNPAENGGAVYLYEWQGDHCVLLQKIIPDDNAEGDHFGNAVCLNGNLLAIGAYFDDDNGSKSGSVYLYKKQDGQYRFTSKIISSDGGFGDAFGSSLAMDQEFLLVGAYADSDQGFFSGSAYVFNLDQILNSSEEKDSKASVHPVLFSNQITVQFVAAKKQPVELQLFNSQGKLIRQWRQKLVRQSVHLGELNTGWYYLRLQSGNDSQIFKLCKLRY
jgi:hypothetical protein